MYNSSNKELASLKGVIFKMLRNFYIRACIRAGGRAAFSTEAFRGMGTLHYSV